MEPEEVCARRVQALQRRGESVWTYFGALVREVAPAFNLGQGFPDWAAPRFLVDAATHALGVCNQYARSQGDLALVHELASRYSTALNTRVHAASNVCVFNGATEAVYCSTQALLNPGDECIVFAPFFDLYEQQVALAGGRLRSVPLVPSPNGEWEFDLEQLEDSFCHRTKLLILNTPHNPTGHVFNRKELLEIAAVVRKWTNVTVLADEVYHLLTYDEVEHVPFASLPGMFEQTITISSAGKTFAVTGWKIGWAVGSQEKIQAIYLVHQSVCFAVCTPLQRAVSDALRIAETPYQGFPSYYAFLKTEYQRKRDLLVQGLRRLGIRPFLPQGSFFVIADVSSVPVPDDFMMPPCLERNNGDTHMDGWKHAAFFTCEFGVCVIPVSAFYQTQHKHLASHLIRIAFCKEDQVIAQALEKLELGFAHHTAARCRGGIPIQSPCASDNNT